MNMQVWIDQRSVKLLQDMAELPFNDEHDYRKLGLIKKALREAAQEIVKRGVERQLADMVSQQAMDPLFDLPADKK